MVGHINEVIIILYLSMRPPRYVMMMGFVLVCISLAIWHQEQGPQKKAYTQSLQIVPCGDRNTVIGCKICVNTTVSLGYNKSSQAHGKYLSVGNKKRFSCKAAVLPLWSLITVNIQLNKWAGTKAHNLLSRLQRLHRVNYWKLSANQH